MTPEERAKRVLDVMAGHWSNYTYEEIVTQFRELSKLQSKKSAKLAPRLLMTMSSKLMS
ncbi:MAG: hypothetical protein J2P21_26815 [Chloracidobacterium sp.]|nr:hypothetical protein [Chloracidobacterium sp.]